jgi:hypothetical protein
MPNVTYRRCLGPADAGHHPTTDFGREPDLLSRAHCTIAADQVEESPDGRKLWSIRARMGGCSGGDVQRRAFPRGSCGETIRHGHKVDLHSATLTALAQLLHVRIVADLGD